MVGNWLALTGRIGSGLRRSCALLIAVALVGCEGTVVTGVPMPKRIVDLSPTITRDLAVRQLGHRACEFLGLNKEMAFTPIVPENKNYTFGLTTFELVSHVGAHIDAPGRLLKAGERADQVPLEKLYGRAQVIDLRWKDRHSALQITDLENAAIAPGSIVILYVGYRQPQGEEWPTYSPISVEAAQWLAGKGILAVATDMPSIGSFSRYAELLDKGRPPQEVWAERLAFSQAGIPVIEGLTNIDQIVNEKQIVFAGFPLAIADRSGAPMRAAALIF